MGIFRWQVTNQYQSITLNINMNLPSAPYATQFPHSHPTMGLGLVSTRSALFPLSLFHRPHQLRCLVAMLRHFQVLLT